MAHDEPWPAGRHGAGTRRGGPREWPRWDPAQGQLDEEQLAALVGVLRGATEPDAVTAAFWEGSGRLAAARVVLWRDDGDGRGGMAAETGPDVDLAVIDGPTLDLPQRSHLVFAGSLDDVAALASGTATADVGPFRPGGRTPSLLWPVDCAWCVATEVDFDSTLVGGPRALVDAVLADETLEALEVSVDDSLGADGDDVN